MYVLVQIHEYMYNVYIDVYVYHYMRRPYTAYIHLLELTHRHMLARLRFVSHCWMNCFADMVEPGSPQEN